MASVHSTRRVAMWVLPIGAGIAVCLCASVGSLSAQDGAAREARGKYLVDNVAACGHADAQHVGCSQVRLGQQIN